MREIQKPRNVRPSSLVAEGRRSTLRLLVRLSGPTMLAQLSSVCMQYIDAAMVGRLGAGEAASIGLVASTTWLLGGLSASLVTGFVVVVAQALGAGEAVRARALVRQAAVVCLAGSLLTALVGLALSPVLPAVLRGDRAIRGDAARYLAIIALSLPLQQVVVFATGMLQATGRMRFPGVMNMLLCVFDVGCNAFCIFPSRSLPGGFKVPGLDLGVAGAALGTALSYLFVALPLLWWLLRFDPDLRRRKAEAWRWDAAEVRHALGLSLPVALERLFQNGAQVVSTAIVGPLGPVALAANSFAVTAESLCYMPAYGVAQASTTLVGQSIGAGDVPLARRFAWLSLALGVVVVQVLAVLMYAFAPWMIGIMTHDPSILSLGVRVLRIEVFAEAMFACSIIATGALRGAGDTLAPSILNLVSMWCVRLPLAALLAPVSGLTGVWLAMCIELNVRGILFLVRVQSGRWLRKATVA